MSGAARADPLLASFMMVFYHCSVQIKRINTARPPHSRSWQCERRRLLWHGFSTEPTLDCSTVFIFWLDNARATSGGGRQ